MLGEKYLKVVNTDEMVFESICEFMIDSRGEAPKISDLVGMVNTKRGLPDCTGRSTSRNTISLSIRRLEAMDLISLRRGGDNDIRSAGSIRIASSRYYIDISTSVARQAIENFHEERLGSKRNSSK